MTELAQELQAAEIEIPEIDPTTGEILEGQHKEAPEERLGQIGRWISGYMNNLDHLATPVSGCFCRNCMQSREFRHVADRLELLRELRDRRITKLKTSIAELEMHAKEIVDTNEGKTVKIAGIGRFGYRKGSESVDMTVYDGLDDFNKKQLQNTRPGLFTIKTTPSKTVISSGLKDGSIKSSTFTLKRSPDTFRFTLEK